jgi:hypothetical protein
MFDTEVDDVADNRQYHAKITTEWMDFTTGERCGGIKSGFINGSGRLQQHTLSLFGDYPSTCADSTELGVAHFVMSPDMSERFSRQRTAQSLVSLLDQDG